MFTEDLSVFFNVTEMATAATLNGVAVTGIYDNEYALQEFGGSASSPSFLMASSAVPATPVGMALVIGATTYKVVETIPDGTGVTMLRLRAGEGAALATVETPVFSPVAGSYGSTQSVTITSATSGASIYYTNDGSAPNATKTLYTGAISVAADVTLKAIAIKAAMTDSAVATAAYVISAAWAPSALFASGEQGAWYDPSDLTTMFQDRAGTTPVTADGQTVGKILDKSGRGKHATAPSDAARPLYKTDGTYHWMQFDGVDDGLATANIDMSASPQMLYSIGCRNIAGASDDFLFEFGTSYNALGGCYYIAPSGYANLNLGGSPVGGDYSSCWAVSSELVYGADFVLSNQIDRTQVGILLEQNIMVNGVDVPPSNPIGSDSGAGNCGVLTLNIGARSNGATGNINARVYQVVMVSGLPSIQERNNLDTWVGIKTGSYGGALVGDLGDSTVAEYGGVPAVVSLIQGAHGNQLAEPGNTISQQQTKWDAQTPAVQQSYQAVVIQASLNDITPSEAAVAVIGRLQTLVNTVVSDTLPNCVVLIATLTPCKARLISLFGAVDGEIAYQRWLSVNEAISGSGATPITGVDGRITSHTVTMNDGSGNLKGIYDSGDGIHPNAAGKQVIADSWRAELVSQGVLS